jgi:hypothetical protein
VLEALLRRDRERLDAVGIARPAGNMDSDALMAVVTPPCT